MSTVSKYILFFGLGFGLLLFSCKTVEQAGRQALENENALLWEISGNGVDGSYLFGTIHLISEEDYFFTDYMGEAFSETDLLALEFNLDDAMDPGNMMAMMEKAFMRNDTTLRDLMSEKDFAVIESHFKEMGLPIFMLQRIKPMFLTIFGSGDLFSGDGFSMDDMKSYELELSEMAKNQSKELAGLETMEYQLGIFDRIPYGDQADMLLESIESGDAQSAEMDSLVHYYKMQNLSKLDEMINSSGPTVEYKDILLDQRNANWIPVIEDLMKKQPTFFAVGAGHLPGKKGVIELLRARGYVLKPVLTSAIGT